MESKRSKYILIGLSVFCILLIGIPVLDHIIIGDGTYVSMKERGL